MKKPTIEELEQILSRDPQAIELLPNGEIRAREATKPELLELIQLREKLRKAEARCAVLIDAIVNSRKDLRKVLVGCPPYLD